MVNANIVFRILLVLLLLYIVLIGNFIVWHDSQLLKIVMMGGIEKRHPGDMRLYNRQLREQIPINKEEVGFDGKAEVYDNNKHMENSEPERREIPFKRVNVSNHDEEQSYVKVHNNWKSPTLPDHLHNVKQTDPDLIGQIRDFWILSPDKLPLNLTCPQETYFSQSGQDKFLDKLFHNKTGGFFIECGAYNGERLSNSLFFERERGWNGLLIEASPENFASLMTKHRNAHMLHACLSSLEEAATLNFTTIQSKPFLSRLDNIFYKDRIRAILHDRVKNSDYIHQMVQCFPFYSILKAMGNPHVDFFSLDVEGSELDVLRTIPLDEVDIDVFLIETCSDKCLGHFTNITSLLEPHGYKLKYIPEVDYDVIMTKI